MESAIALGNNDVVMLAWSYDQEIANCLGFAIYRLHGGDRTPLPAWVGFQGQSNADWDPSTTERWPIQKYWWRDLTASRGEAYQYEIVPRVGQPDNMTSLEDRRLMTNEVTLTPVCSEHVSAYFNRGILSTQALAHKLPHDAQGAPSSAELMHHITTPDDPIRMALAGQIIEALSLIPRKARADGGHVYGAIYELKDPELVELLKDPEHISLVLSNAGSSDDPDATNRAAREELHGAHVDVTDRMLGSGHIGHNKSLILVDTDDAARMVLSGSTNFTSTALAAQANNAIIIEDDAIGSHYRDYWKTLKSECPPDPAQHATQSDAMRTSDNALTLESIKNPFAIDGATVALCLSPNTKQHQKPSHSQNPNPDRPSDLAALFELIKGAKHAILFLLFQPGQPSVLDAILDAQTANPRLFVRGAATDPKAIENYDTTLFHRIGDHPEVAAATAVDHAFGFWQKELLKSSPDAHAIIHDKIVVIDPMSDDCVVGMGSHNLGYTASYANDENLLIIRGHRRLAAAYATHVMDIYDHYRWRWRHRPQAGNGAAHEPSGLATNDQWQGRYFTDPQAVAERTFWLDSAPAPEA